MNVSEVTINPTYRRATVRADERSVNILANPNRVDVRVDSLTVRVVPRTVRVVNRVTTVAPVIRDIQVQVVTLAVRGQQGADGSGAITVPFEWNSISILPVTIAVFGKAVLVASVCIVEAFDGVSPSLSIGDSADHQRLLPASYVDPSQAVTFLVHPGHRYSNSTQINLYITPGAGASRGSGVVTIEMEQ